MKKVNSIRLGEFRHLKKEIRVPPFLFRAICCHVFLLDAQSYFLLQFPLNRDFL